MRLVSLRIKNYRSFEDETIRFDSYSVLVGPNGVGKSTVLCALNVLFREKENSSTDSTVLDEQDFHKGNIDAPVEVVATFDNLSEAAAEDLKDYVRHGRLIVAAVASYDKVTRRADVKQYGERLGMAEFAGFFKAQNDGEKVSALKEIYTEIRGSYPELPAPSTGAAMMTALHDYESAHVDLCIPLRSADSFYGARKGRLDPYIQWVYVPAVKDAKHEQVESKNTALGKLLSRTVRAKTNFDDQVEQVRVAALEQYDGLLAKNQEALAGISSALTERLREWSHPDATLKVVWGQDAERAVRIDPPMAKAIAGEAGFEGDVSRLGHGLQRSFILAVLHELAQIEDEGVPTLLLGVEEPELYQHPPQARHLATVLLRIAAGNSQVIATTHSPIFASGQSFESVRMFRRGDGNRPVLSSATYDEVSAEVAAVTGEAPIKPEGMRAKIHQALLWSLSDMFFASKVVFVEGAEDLSYVSYYLQATDQLDALRAAGVNIVATSSKSGMVQAAAIAKALGIPAYLIWDADGQEENAGRRARHERDNVALQKLRGLDTPDAFPATDVIGDSYTSWAEEIASRVRRDSGDKWAAITTAASDACGYAGSLDKNAIYISELLIAAFEAGVDLSGMKALAARINTFAGINKE